MGDFVLAMFMREGINPSFRHGKKFSPKNATDMVLSVAFLYICTVKHVDKCIIKIMYTMMRKKYAL